MIDPFHNMPPEAKLLADTISLTALLGSLMEYIPAVAALLTIVWTAIRIFETDTIQRIFKRKK